MEYLFIIAFVGLIIFKAIRGSNRAKKEETGKTMLPGQRPAVPVERRKAPEPSDSWEEWFASDSPVIKVSAEVRRETAYKPIVTAPSPQHKENKKNIHHPDSFPVNSFRLDSKENVRRAIIYSEIINRKY